MANWKQKTIYQVMHRYNELDPFEVDCFKKVQLAGAIAKFIVRDAVEIKVFKKTEKQLLHWKSEDNNGQEETKTTG